ncbi:MAG: hypothetical protein E7484_05725 [Ruminococcaceae bacterium]|nr:hypothetical protein [Oscillospiraceae bacterium]
MNNKLKKVIIIILALLICTGTLFIYEVKKEHHYTPQTAEIVFDDTEHIKNALILRDNTPANFNLSEHLTFISDIEKRTAGLAEKKKVFGFYECDINYVYAEYNPVISYSISDDNIAEIDANGVITAMQKGEAVITVTADNVSIDIPVTVYRGVLTTEMEQDVVLLKGESKSFLKLEQYDVSLSEFYSSDEKVVTVSQNGTAAAVSKGKAEIYTYKDEAKTDKVSAMITVKQPVESASMNNLTLYVGETATLKAAYLPLNADYGTSFTYNSLTASVATVSGNTVTAVKAGETIITATSANGVSTQAKLVVLVPPKATPTVTTISKAEYDSYTGEKFTDGSPYASYFKISFDHPVAGFRINYVTDDFVSKTTGSAIYNNASVAANSPLYFAVCINESDVIDTRGFSYTNRDGSKKYYSLHVSGKDGSVLMTEY